MADPVSLHHHPSRPRSHYRPVSTLLEPAQVQKHLRHSHYRTSFAMNFMKRDKRAVSDVARSGPPPAASRFATFSKALKKKTSYASILSSTSDGTLMPASPPTPSAFTYTYSSSPSPPITPTEDDLLLLSADNEDLDILPAQRSAPGRFVAKPTVTVSSGQRVHPYPEDAVYMQGYDAVSLDNDRHTDLLLRRLNPLPSPSFHDYGNEPPASVLDLGCGQGDWVMHAASCWKRCQIVGFDLVNVLSPELDGVDNVTFVQGNFLKYKLPFANRSFELVRMANLSLSIPAHKWEYVISEAYRVLSWGGRLELIDDDMFFPHGNEPRPSGSSLRIPTTPSKPHFPAEPPASASFFDFTSPDDEEDGDDIDLPEFGSTDQFGIDRSTLDCLVSSDSTPTVLSSVDDRDEGASAWSDHLSVSKELETLFGDMLHGKFGIHTKPSEILPAVMSKIFGQNNACKRSSMHLQLAPADSTPKTGSSRGIFRSNSVETFEQHSPIRQSSPSFPEVDSDGIYTDSEDESSYEGPIAPRTSAKAAGRLGISYSALLAATATTQAQRNPASSSRGASTPSLISDASSASSSQASSQKLQSPGLILWPSTFIPMHADELEMHTCKHLHTLLGCKLAIADYVDQFVDDNGTKMVSEESFNESIWTYESFRRQRFNWPHDTPDLDMVTDSNISELPLFAVSKAQSTSSPSSSKPSAYGDELPHVRTIRVYDAVKSRGTKD